MKKALIFQFKLGLDALRDLLLSPVSIVLVVVDILLGHDQQKSYFNRLMHYGRLSDRWINLFEENPDFWDQRKNIDGYIDKISHKIGTQPDDKKE